MQTAIREQESGAGSMVSASVVASSLLLAQFSTAFPLRLLPLLAPLAFATAGATSADIGFYTAAAAAGALCGSLALVRLQRSFGAIGVLRLSMAVAAIAALCMAGATPWLFLLGSFLAGLSDGPTPAAGTAELHRATPQRLRTSFFSIKMLGGAAGGMIAGVLFPAAAARWSWISACWIAAAVALAVLLYISATSRFWPAEPPVAHQPSACSKRTVAYREVLANSEARQLAWLGLVMSVVQGVWYGYYVLYLVEELGLSITHAGAMLSVGLFGLLASRMLLGVLAYATGRGDRILGWVCVVSALPWIALMLLTPDSVDRFIPAISAGFGATLGAWVGLQHAEIAYRMPSGLILPAASLVSFLMFLGLAVSGVLFAILLKLTGNYGIGFASLSVLSFGVGAQQLFRSYRTPIRCDSDKP